MRLFIFLLASVVAAASADCQTAIKTALGGAEIAIFDPVSQKILLDEAKTRAYLAAKHPKEAASEARLLTQGAHAYLVYHLSRTNAKNVAYTSVVAEELFAPAGTGTGILEQQSAGEEHECSNVCTKKATAVGCAICVFAHDERGKIVGCRCDADGSCCHKIRAKQ